MPQLRRLAMTEEGDGSCAGAMAPTAQRSLASPSFLKAGACPSRGVPGLAIYTTFRGPTCLVLRGCSTCLFPCDLNSTGRQVALRTVWQKTLRRAKVTYFRIYDLGSTYATRLSAGGVAAEWVTQLLRQGDSQIFRRYSQMKLQMKREALEKINRQANEMPLDSATAMVQ